MSSCSASRACLRVEQRKMTPKWPHSDRTTSHFGIDNVCYGFLTNIEHRNKLRVLPRMGPWTKLLSEAIDGVYPPGGVARSNCREILGNCGGGRRARGFGRARAGPKRQTL